MYEVEYIKRMTRSDGSQVDVLFFSHYKHERSMYCDIKDIVADCIKEGTWMQFRYIGAAR